MKKIMPLFLLPILVLACGLFQPTPEPTASATSTITDVPTETEPPPTITPIPSATLASSDPGSFATLAVADGFTISVPFPLLHDVNRNVVIIGNEENTLTLSFASDSFSDSDTLEDVMDSYLGSLENRGWVFTKSEPTDVEIDGASGILIDLTATAENLNFAGQAVTVSPRSDLVLFGLGLSQASADPEGWSNSGQGVFNSLLENITFTEAAGECPIATDETYGYTESNPIRVGGGSFDGPSRERGYLDHLRGPNGETLSYERQGSLPSGDTILDIYQITGPGMDETLYIDEYNFEELKAPVGFTCNGAFPLSAP